MLCSVTYKSLFQTICASVQDSAVLPELAVLQEDWVYARLCPAATRPPPLELHCLTLAWVPAAGCTLPKPTACAILGAWNGNWTNILGNTSATGPGIVHSRQC